MSREVDHSLEETRFGFRWGPMLVERVCSDDRFGFVLHVTAVDHRGTHRRLAVRVSPHGATISTDPYQDKFKPALAVPTEEERAG